MGWKSPLYSQDTSEIDKWDNVLYLGNKVALGTGKWRFSGELQIRLRNNLKSLDNWYFEAIGSRLLTKHWQIQIPVRYTIKPTLNEFRPGLGVFYKMYPEEKMQLAHQVMYQADINSQETKHGLRYALFYTWRATEKWIPTAAAGIFYRWQNNFNGIQFIRAGPGLGYQVDVKHFISLNYLIGFENRGEQWTYQGIFFFQLVININKDYQYLPARAIQF
jgi:hypothetical protein